MDAELGAQMCLREVMDINESLKEEIFRILEIKFPKAILRMANMAVPKFKMETYDGYGALLSYIDPIHFDRCLKAFLSDAYATHIKLCEIKAFALTQEYFWPTTEKLRDLRLHFPSKECLERLIHEQKTEKEAK